MKRAAFFIPVLVFSICMTSYSLAGKKVSTEVISMDCSGFLDLIKNIVAKGYTSVQTVGAIRRLYRNIYTYKDEQGREQLIYTNPESPLYWEAELTRISATVVLYTDILDRTRSTLNEFDSGKDVHEPWLNKQTVGEYWEEYDLFLRLLNFQLSQEKIDKYLCNFEKSQRDTLAKRLADLKLHSLSQEDKAIERPQLEQR